VQKYQLEVYGRRKQIVVNVPTRFGSNFFVLRSILDTRQALTQAVADEGWSGLGGKGEKLRDIVERSLPQTRLFWENVALLIELLQPFSDAIHKLEADLPMLGQCHEVVAAPQQHVQVFVAKHKDARGGNIVICLLETFDRRYKATARGARAPIHNPAYVVTGATRRQPRCLRERTLHIGVS
jgi:hypothetical protein